jgi:hypothetical protein
MFPPATMGNMATNKTVPDVGPKLRPVLSHKEELFAAELKAIRALLTEITENLNPPQSTELSLAHKPHTPAQ